MYIFVNDLRSIFMLYVFTKQNNYLQYHSSAENSQYTYQRKSSRIIRTRLPNS